MLRFGHLLSLLALLSLACGALSNPTIQAATPILKAGTRVPTSIPPDAEEFPTQNAEELPELPHSALVDVYDPSRDPAEDLKQAIVFAQRQKKRIIFELGGDWCIWCKWMDEFYATYPDILQFRAEHYILVKVNVSEENMNEEFLSQFPAASGYPHIYILDSDGTFLHSQDTVELEDGGESYVPEVFMSFLQKWALPE